MSNKKSPSLTGTSQNLLAVPPRFPTLVGRSVPRNRGAGGSPTAQGRVQRAAQEGFSFTCFHPAFTIPGSLLDSIELLVSVTA
ncbi:MAG: hypothetical protein M0P11_05020 [Anaerolineaceae bacterium]|nr:hypothetical protein [Anaerolineaceae bacterium]